MSDRVRVVSLPDGPAGSPTPILQVEAFFFSEGNEPKRRELALKFAQFAASEVNQMLLAQEVQLVPSDRMAMETLEDPAMAIIARQAAETAVVLPADIAREVIEAGDRVYGQVLVEGVEPEVAVDAFAQTVTRE
jgi:ABC-type glycerol-3-phosphate transport system substrate-binding protein